MYPTVIPGEEITLNVELFRTSRPPTNGAYTPKFPKRKEEGWWLIIGDPSTGELLALRRIQFPGKKTSVNLSFEAPDLEGKYNYNLYYMSDSYIGLDQQYQVSFKVERMEE